jgi:hypothetical protein
MTSAVVKPKPFFPSKDSAQPDHFLLHKEKLPSYPVLFIASLELSCRSLTYHRSVFYGKFKVLNAL